MADVSLSEARDNFEDLVARAEAGEEIGILRNGKTVARLVTAQPPGEPFDIEALKALTERQPMQSESAGPFVRRMRDEDRY
ncbi:MAG: type II toxin-antitoxin system prevent-host-death family antitoxin [Rhodospirillaceae bacterium]